jgi:hypothetical protein
MKNEVDAFSPLAMTVNKFRHYIGGISRSHFYELVARDKIRVVKLGHRTLVPTSEAQRLLAVANPPDRRPAATAELHAETNSCRDEQRP